MTAMVPISLRDYQRRAVESLGASVRAGARPILVCPTGGGKTVIACGLIQNESVPTLFIAHRREIIRQTAKRLEADGVRAGIILAGEPRYTALPVQVASVQTLQRRQPPAARLVIWDECHHCASESFRKVAALYPAAAHVGLTATPFRLDGRGLGDAFNEIIVAAYPDELVESGFLVEPRVYAPPAASMHGVKLRGGDFEAAALAKRVDRPRLVGDIIAEWKKHAAGKRTIVFAANVLHSRHIIDCFRSAGIAAEHIDGTTEKKERDRALERLTHGETLVLSNCALVSEGWDLPSLECAIVARPTASLCLHIQQIGRVMRSALGKSGAIVLDHAGNFLRHGRVTRRLEYSLDGAVKAAAKGTGLKTCFGCYRMVLASRTVCPECGTDLSAKPMLPETEAGELEEFAVEKVSVEEREAFFRATYDECVKTGRRPGWVYYRFKEKFGYAPVVVVVDGVGHLAHPESSEDVKLAALEKFQKEGAERNFKPGYALARFKELFGHYPRFRSTRKVVMM